ncbi:hypothetical protein DIU31_005880 [Mucilaginibacter rubeus]|uniref:Uncharacterized protein n=1 Tax=Mucilaginibacter rubeus TaxID=2027860 RepID=A0AAE6JCE0_9SPHI|nr:MULTISPECIES: hypothetical protein [Mucilaginibacter]QEM03072.1 hypothetical protein DIU31_005880 [Mucilaginibacter rubeus]QEM15691.1 hypothetical protein DIU38_005950 [Mucilaginibacter gossypii]QTE41573.1 hypothetical protein J3L19_21840 [Mucilaginibacter rubeus]QTE48179.1 hypothetical protein J3L21_21840 [Mucilaginibacter rubeus]QTE59569.1 hypothetical protein J3L23_13480 [Mucilaginibacter rubeus]
MEELTICYEYDFALTVRKKNGRLYKNHHIGAIGISFSTALFDAYTILKKQKCEILAINHVKAKSIAFAFDKDGAAVKISLKDRPPVMPDDYEKELSRLPKKH